MCLASMLQTQIAARRSRRLSRKVAKLAKNDHQRPNENLLRIALERSNSVNSLTRKKPAGTRAVAVAEPVRENE